MSCPIRGCGGLQIHVLCGARCQIDQNVGDSWAVLRHRGVHRHDWAEAKKADPLSKEKLKDAVINDPKTGPLALKVCEKIGLLPSQLKLISLISLISTNTSFSCRLAARIQARIP